MRQTCQEGGDMRKNVFNPDLMHKLNVQQSE